MANTDKPFGAVPYGPILHVGEYNKDTTAGAIYPGDFVKLEADGNIDQAAAGDRILGVSLDYMASADSGYINVADHPKQEFVIQDNAATTLALTDIGQLMDILATDGDTDTLRSQMEMDSTTPGTAAAQLRIVGIDRRPDNSAGNNADWIVEIYEHERTIVDPTTPGV
ncbi:MAG: hypothetical protein ACE5LU_29125 [Anaerolineae bacterium]